MRRVGSKFSITGTFEEDELELTPHSSARQQRAEKCQGENFLQYLNTLEISQADICAWHMHLSGRLAKGICE
jgi:hypothetical protein